MHSKAQADAMRYVIIAVVIVVIGLLGYGAILKLSDKLCEADIAHFKILLAELDKGLKPGSAEQMQLEIPCGADEIYFVDLDKTIDPDLLSYNPLLRDSIKDKSQRNVFLLKRGELLDSFHVGDLDISYPHYVCMLPRSERIDFSIEGKSGEVGITPGCEQLQCGFLPNEQNDSRKAVTIFDSAKRFGSSAYCGGPRNCQEDITTEFARYFQAKENIEIKRMFDYCRETGLTHVTIEAKPKGDAKFTNLRFYEFVPQECSSSLERDLEGLSHNLGDFEWQAIADNLFMWNLRKFEGNVKFSYTLNKSLSDHCLRTIATYTAASVIENGKVVPVPDMPGLEDDGSRPNRPPELQLPSGQEIDGKLGSRMVIPRIYRFARDPDISAKQLGYSIVSQTRPQDVNCQIQSNEHLVCTVLINDHTFSDITIEAFDGHVSVRDTFRLRISRFIPPPFCGNGACDDQETCESCRQDCGSCIPEGTNRYLVCGINPITLCRPPEEAGQCPGETRWDGETPTLCGVAWKQFKCYEALYNTEDCSVDPSCPAPGVVLDENPCNW